MTSYQLDLLIWFSAGVSVGMTATMILLAAYGWWGDRHWGRR